jgi:SPP1 family phage portal protein
MTMTQVEIALQKLAAYGGQIGRIGEGLEAAGRALMSDIINDLITEAKTRHGVQGDLYLRYKADDATVPVFLRTFTDTTKINNKLNNSFDSEIVDTKIGYMFGRPVVYSIDKTEYQDEQGQWADKAGYDAQQTVIDEFAARNMLDDLDAETGKMAAICGMAARLCYIDRDGKERVMNVPPWECVWVYDASINEPQYALRYYTVQVQDSGTWVERTRVEWYDAANVTFYVSDKEGQYSLDQSEGYWDAPNERWVTVNPKPHMFDGIPLIAFPNNEEAQGDSEKVLELIDGYDRAFSDVNSELDQFRLAYMKFIGATVDAETVANAQKTGAFGLPPDADVGFIEKNINDAFVENHLNRLEQNILRFAKHVNFGDEAFAGNQSGVALKFKLFGLDAKCQTTELKFRRALQQMWRVICSAWHRKSKFAVGKDRANDYLQIHADFSRNFPLHLLEEAEATGKLKGMVSEITRLKLLPFVEDPAKELELMQAEQAEAMAAQVELYGAQAEIDRDGEGEDAPE